MKICTKCKVNKEVTEFRTRGKAYFSWCRKCERYANQKRSKLKVKIYKQKEKNIKSDEEIKLKARDRMLKHRYKIGIEEYNNLYIQQDMKCGICETPRKLGGKDGLYVDHNHNTGEVRGLLCPSCNMAIGLINESKFVIDNILKYLKL